MHYQETAFENTVLIPSVKPHSSVGSNADLRTGGRWFDIGQYSFGGLMIVIATGFIPLSPLLVNIGYHI